MQETYLKTIAEPSVDVVKRRCPTVKSWPFCCIFILVHSAILSTTTCSSLRVRWSRIFRKLCRTTALWSWKAACSSSSYFAEAVWLPLWGWDSAGDRGARKYEKQADAVLWQNDAAQEIHYVSLTTSRRHCKDTASKTLSNFHCSKDRIISFDSLYTAHVWWHGKRTRVSVFTCN